MNQPYLPYQDHSRTSRSAARTYAPHEPTGKQKVLDFIRAHGPITDNQGIASGVVGVNTWRPRRVSLVQEGSVVQVGELDGCALWDVKRGEA